MVNMWPNWLGQGLYVYGPKGCGKTHLAHIFMQNVQRSAAKPVKVSILNAAQIHLRSVKRIAEENQCIVIENLTPKVHEEALFHLFNLFNVDGKYMLWTSEYAPNHMHFMLKDLQSRLKMLPAVAIKEPDDVMLQMLIVKLFNDRQLRITPEILNYICLHARRSFGYICDLVPELDALSMAYQKSIDFELIEMAIEVLQSREKRQPDLFDER